MNKTIAVLDTSEPEPNGLMWTIVVAGQVRNSEHKRMTEDLECAIAASGAFDLVDRHNLQRVLAEHQLQVSDLTAPEKTVEVGRLIGVDGIVTVGTSGEVVWVGPVVVGESSVVAKLIDVETGRIMWTAHGGHNVVTIVPVPPFWEFKNTPEKKMAREILKKIRQAQQEPERDK